MNSPVIIIMGSSLVSADRGELREERKRREGGGKVMKFDLERDKERGGDQDSNRVGCSGSK